MTAETPSCHCTCQPLTKGHNVTFSWVPHGYAVAVRTASWNGLIGSQRCHNRTELGSLQLYRFGISHRATFGSRLLVSDMSWFLFGGWCWEIFDKLELLLQHHLGKMLKTEKNWSQGSKHQFVAIVHRLSHLGLLKVFFRLHRRQHPKLECLSWVFITKCWDHVPDEIFYLFVQ